MKLKISGGLFKCGRCRRSYSNPLGHACTVRMDRKTPVGKTRIAPKVSVAGHCPSCGRPRSNPFTHVCAKSSDFKKRKTAAAKTAKKARPQHLYQDCRDDDCARVGCVAFKEGRALGNEEGSASGYESGFTAGAASVSTTSGG